MSRAWDEMVAELRNEGEVKGLAKGREEGMAKGREEGMAKGMAKGREEERKTLLQKLCASGALTPEQIQSILGISLPCPE